MSSVHTNERAIQRLAPADGESVYESRTLAQIAPILTRAAASSGQCLSQQQAVGAAIALVRQPASKR
jgi:hypothetical protein